MSEQAERLKASDTDISRLDQEHAEKTRQDKMNLDFVPLCDNPHLGTKVRIREGKIVEWKN